MRPSRQAGGARWAQSGQMWSSSVRTSHSGGRVPDAHSLMQLRGPESAGEERRCQAGAEKWDLQPSDVSDGTC